MTNEELADKLVAEVEKQTRPLPVGAYIEVLEIVIDTLQMSVRAAKDDIAHMLWLASRGLTIVMQLSAASVMDAMRRLQRVESEHLAHGLGCLAAQILVRRRSTRACPCRSGHPSQAERRTTRPLSEQILIKFEVIVTTGHMEAPRCGQSAAAVPPLRRGVGTVLTRLPSIASAISPCLRASASSPWAPPRTVHRRARWPVSRRGATPTTDG